MDSAEHIDLAKLDQLKVDDIKKALKSRGLDTSGVKAVIKERLKQALESEPALEGGAKAAAIPAGAVTTATQASATPKANIPASGGPDLIAKSANATIPEKSAVKTAVPAPAAGPAPTGSVPVSNKEPTTASKPEIHAVNVSSDTQTTADKEKALLEEDAKRRARAERFGTPYKPLGKLEELKKQKRAERFHTEKANETVDEIKHSGTKEVVDPEEEERRRKRAARFNK